MSENPEQSPLDQAADTAQHTAQAAYAVSSAVRNGAAVAGAATGTALGGPLGTVVGMLVTSKTFWKVFGSLLAVLFLWLVIIIHLIGIIFSYAGFMDADSYVNTAQSAEVSSLQVQIDKVLEKEGYKTEILKLLEEARDKQLQEISADKEANFLDYELKVIDEYEKKLKKNLSLYLSNYMAETWDTSTIRSFIGYSNSLGMGLDTELNSPYDAYFREAAQTYGVSEALLKAIGKVESDYNPKAVSGAGAMGIMQLMPATAKSLGVTDPYDPRQNIMGGAKYIASNLEQFKFCTNALELAIAAYNAGPNAVIKAGYQIPSSGVQGYVEKVLSYISIQENITVSNEDEEAQDYIEKNLEGSYNQMKALITENVDDFFVWSVTDQMENEVSKEKYYLITEDDKTEIDETTYATLREAGENVGKEVVTESVFCVEYTLALMMNSQVMGNTSSHSFKYVTDPSTFELVIKMLTALQEGPDALKKLVTTDFSWTDFITGGDGEDSYYGNIDAAGDVITYDTVGGCIKNVVYFNQGEEPWASMPYGTTTIKSAGCGPTSLAVVISTLTGKNITPQMTCDFAIQNGEYVSGSGTSHSFPTNAASHWGLTVERVGKNRMDYILQSLKRGKLVVVICAENTITGSGNGHYIVLTGVTESGYITIADCGSRERTGKVYSVETIQSYGRNLSEGAFWIIGK